jgi:hypothetical protein
VGGCSWVICKYFAIYIRDFSKHGFLVSQGFLPSYTEEKSNGKKSSINFIVIFSSNSI